MTVAFHTLMIIINTSILHKMEFMNWYFNVTNVQKKENYVIHFGTVEDGKIQVGNKLTQLDFNENHRIGCMRNHTATHLLNSSLRNLFGHVQQLGSTVDSERSKFKFSCHVPLTTAHLDVVQNDILNLIQTKLPVTNISTSASEVMKNQDIIKIPNEYMSSYLEWRLAVSIHVKNTESKHLYLHHPYTDTCSHVMNTSDLESFCIIKLNRLGTNNNRIVCVTGDLAKEAYMVGKQLTEMYDKFEQELPYLDLSIGLLRNEFIPHQIREDISNKVNKATLRKLKNQKMHEEAKAIEQVQKILVEKTVNHPVIFLSENDYWTMAVVHCPQVCHKEYLSFSSL
ncbi:hypothetical protein KUTeg_001554 [Tegillarca granosa]|uniref:Alanyl-transfer RNA synthetases family profile domain-containing protein n=1 Tax=Tegillarca granosa TaxID=220873 RepID=A0ABQ9FTC1_TEGGR|nr:hypothetical protein KUTeg_001554 [Tegillarca granosa]